MTWELGYFGGLLTGASVAGLACLFLHAGAWADWLEELETARRDHVAALSACRAAEGRADDAEADAARHRIERDCDRGDLDRVSTELAEAGREAERRAAEFDAAFTVARHAAARDRDESHAGLAAVTAERDAARAERDASSRLCRHAVKDRDAAEAQAGKPSAYCDGIAAERDKLSAEFDALNAAYQVACREAAACRTGLARLAAECEAIRAGS